MALATRCPACSTVFRISTAQAAAKGGMVRCGHCSNVFNSLDALVRVEDLEILDESSVATAPTAASTAAPSAAPTVLVRDEPEPVEATIEDFAQSEVSSVLADLSTPTDPDAHIQEWWMPAPPPAPRRSRSTFVSSPVTRTDPTAVPTEVATLRDPPPLGDDPPWSAGATGGVFMQRPGPPEYSRTPARWAWGSLGLVAALLLVAQLAYVWRDELAVRWSPSRPWLTAACRLLECTVDYPARPDAIGIESASVQTATAGPNLYVLTALLRNRDTTDVRYPHLELTLTDTDDRPVLRRVLRPEDYLALPRDGKDRIGPSFAAQSELPVRVTFELNNLRFAGYRLEHFYP